MNTRRHCVCRRSELRNSVKSLSLLRLWMRKRIGNNHHHPKRKKTVMMIVMWVESVSAIVFLLIKIVKRANSNHFSGRSKIRS